MMKHVARFAINISKEKITAVGEVKEVRAYVETPVKYKSLLIATLGVISLFAWLWLGG